MKKLAYIGYIAAPTQVKLCYALQKYFDTRFWFYDELGDRPDWWMLDLGDKCQIVEPVFFKKSAKYVTLSHLKMLRTFDPDILLLSGFSVPASLLAYWWGKKNDKKVVFFTERSRDENGNLRKKGFFWSIIRCLYRKVDLIMVSADDIVSQFRDEFKFGDIVVASQYASDIDSYFYHKLRQPKIAYNFLFANRLTEIYNPFLAIDIFQEISSNYSGSHLYMNARGELRVVCEQKIRQLNLENDITFLDDISSWEQLHLVYQTADIMLLPANFSNGNFTIIEAMASGMGIVISEKVLGIGKLIEDGLNGFNCEHKKEAYIEAIESYIKNPTLFVNHAEINRQKTQPLTVAATAKLYHQQLSQLF